jgi:hypothetical protein
MQQKDNNLPVGRHAITTETYAAKSKPGKHTAVPPVLKTGTPKAARVGNGLRKSRDNNFVTPAVSRFTGGGKENDTPSTSGSRKSKDIAVARLQEIAPDIALYEKEKKRVGGVLYGGGRKSDQKEQNGSRKRSIEPDEETDTGELNDGKKAKKSKPPVTMHLLLTGYQRWVGNPKLEDADKVGPLLY